MSLPTKWFQPPVKPQQTDKAGIVELPSLPEMSFNTYDADDETHDSSDLGGTEG